MKTNLITERPEVSVVTVHPNEVREAIDRTLETARVRNSGLSTTQTLDLDAKQFFEPLLVKVGDEEESVWSLCHVGVDVRNGFVEVWIQQTVGPGYNRYCHLHHWGSPQRAAIVTIIGDIDFYEKGVRAELQRAIEKRRKVPRPRNGQ